MTALRLTCALGVLAAAVSGCGGSSEDSSTPGQGGTAGAAGSGGSAGMPGSGGTSGGGAGGSGGMGAGGTGGSGAGPAAACLADINDGPVMLDYDQFNPVIGSHCVGTDHQNITGVEKLVFLGDSITAGSPPTPSAQFYRVQLAAALTQKFPGLEVANCSKGGATLSDLMASGDRQIQACFPGVENKHTLTVFTIGGNDLVDLAQSKATPASAMAKINQMLTDLRDAVTYLKDPNNFPNGSDVVFANIYEYTDASGDLSSCPLAVTAGLSGSWLDGIAIVKALREGYMKIAVDTQSDMLFLGESFCGHGYKAGDASGQCYRGPGAENWFDVTCIHPTPTGHTQIADLFGKIVDG